MASQGERSAGNQPIVQKVWTLRIEGGIPFSLQVHRHPIIDHDGGVTLGKIVGDSAVAQQAASTIRSRFGASVSLHTEEQSPEQLAERLGLDKVMPTYVYRCETCGHQFERVQRMDAPNPTCPVERDKSVEADEIPQIETCGGDTQRLIVPGGTFHLKGDGWAKDGY